MSDLEQFKNYLKELAKEQAQKTDKGHKNEGLYMVCCALALAKLAEGTNYGQEEWKYFYTAHSAAEHYYEEMLEKGELELL